MPKIDTKINQVLVRAMIHKEDWEFIKRFAKKNDRTAVAQLRRIISDSVSRIKKLNLTKEDD
ncbi:MAG: hypothetical protein V3U94_02855 [Candidatus Thorarchaeota archaeon]